MTTENKFVTSEAPDNTGTKNTTEASKETEQQLDPLKKESVENDLNQILMWAELFQDVNRIIEEATIHALDLRFTQSVSIDEFNRNYEAYAKTQEPAKMQDPIFLKGIERIREVLTTDNAELVKQYQARARKLSIQVVGDHAINVIVPYLIMLQMNAQEPELADSKEFPEELQNLVKNAQRRKITPEEFEIIAKRMSDQKTNFESEKNKLIEAFRKMVFEGFSEGVVAPKL
ncbi:MAG: hypothetical protein WCW31_02965 [Patescibacteria group bacterium]|jgi:hypothetical protein